MNNFFTRLSMSSALDKLSGRRVHKLDATSRCPAAYFDKVFAFLEVAQ